LSNKFKIAVLPGDGIGPEVSSEAIKVIKAMGIDHELLFGDIGSVAYNETGTPIPENTKRICEEANSVLLGAIGHSYAPYGIPALVTEYLQIEKDAFVNLSPLKLYPGIYRESDPHSGSNIDIIVVRSNIEGFSIPHEGYLWKEEGKDLRVISHAGAKRVAEFAFNYSSKKRRKKITCIDAHNLLHGDKLFRNAFAKVAEEYPDIEADYLSVNVASMMLNMSPADFDVILTHDIFGNMMTWQVIGHIGGIGVASQANLGDNFSVFQPIGGAAWKIAGKRIANPIGSILAVKLMFERCEYLKEASMIEEAVKTVIKEGKVLTSDLGGSSRTDEVGDAVIAEINKLFP
jgi:isocitrate/isopropylmalate dehydrogenase